MASVPTTLVLGIGNLLLGDEGVGVHVARELQQLESRPPADVVDGGTGGFHLLEYFERYDRLLIVDAAMDGEAPGTVRLLRPRFASDFPACLTAHEIGLKQLIDATYLLSRRPEVRLITISIERVPDLQLELSAAVRAAIPAALGLIRQQLAEPWDSSSGPAC